MPQPHPDRHHRQQHARDRIGQARRELQQHRAGQRSEYRAQSLCGSHRACCGALFIGLHRIGGQCREGREHEAHAGCRHEVAGHQHPALCDQHDRHEAQTSHAHADADHGDGPECQSAHHQLAQDQRNADHAQRIAGGSGASLRAHAQLVDHEKSHGDLAGRYGEQGREGREHGAAQTWVGQQAAASPASAGRRRCIGQVLPQRNQPQQGQQRGEIEWGFQSEPGQLACQCRSQHQAHAVGRTERGHGVHAALGRQVVGDQRLAGRGGGGVETAHCAPRGHQPGKDQPAGHGDVHGRDQPDTHGQVTDEKACKPGHQDAPATVLVAEPPPDGGSHHPQKAPCRHRQTGLPGQQPQMPRQRADDGHEGHHCHGAAHVGKEDGAQGEAGGGGAGCIHPADYAPICCASASSSCIARANEGRAMKRSM